MPFRQRDRASANTPKWRDIDILRICDQIKTQRRPNNCRIRDLTDLLSSLHEIGQTADNVSLHFDG